MVFHKLLLMGTCTVLCWPASAVAQQKADTATVVVADTGSYVTYRIRLDQGLRPKCECNCVIRDPEGNTIYPRTLEGVTDKATCKAADGDSCRVEGDLGTLENCGIVWQRTLADFISTDFKLEAIPDDGEDR